uniref:killin n=1 Tax=Arvicanthis niloticus TaxID=61156 RepID=UPI001487011C|nr:killin [Arvicanthis niloticus]
MGQSEAAASEWAGRAGLGGLKGEVEGYMSGGRNYFQEEVTCGPNDLSCPPLPCGLLDPSLPGRSGEQHPRAVRRSAVGAKRLGSWLHKQPHPSTCPRHPSLLAAAGLCTLTRRVPKLFLPFACNP